MQIIYFVTHICMVVLLKILFFPIKFIINAIGWWIQKGIIEVVSTITILIIVGIVVSQKI